MAASVGMTRSAPSAGRSSAAAISDVIRDDLNSLGSSIKKMAKYVDDRVGPEAGARLGGQIRDYVTRKSREFSKSDAADELRSIANKFSSGQVTDALRDVGKIAVASPAGRAIKAIANRIGGSARSVAKSAAEAVLSRVNKAKQPSRRTKQQLSSVRDYIKAARQGKDVADWTISRNHLRNLSKSKSMSPMAQKLAARGARQMTELLDKAKA